MESPKQTVPPVHDDEIKTTPLCKCNECNSAFEQKANLRRHQANAHFKRSKDGDVRSIKPSKIKKSITSNLPHRKLKSTHKQKETTRKAFGVSMYSCDKCKKVYSCRKRLLTHMKFTSHGMKDEMQTNCSHEKVGDSITV